MIGIILAAFVWRPIRWHFINIPVASASAIFVAFTKWPLAIVMGAFFLYKNMWLNSFIAFFWPILVIGVSYAYAGGTKGIGDYEVRFTQKMGYDIPELSKW
jgi:hypothetical protein